jgi:hypothetical protein
MTNKDSRPASGPLQTRGVPDDLLRAARLCHPDWESAGRVTFRPPMADWAVWRETIFLPAVLPAFESAFAAFAQGHRKELAKSDALLETVLPPDLAGSSRRAGRLLAAGYTVPNAEKVWQHHCARVAAEESPGHFAVMLAIRAAAFHLPLGAAVSVLLFLEARGGNPDGRPQEWMEMIAAARPQDRGIQLRAA